MTRTYSAARSWSTARTSDEWTLKNIPSLVAEYWSNIGVIGDPVSSWADQSGNSGVPLVQTDVSYRPDYEATGWGGDSGPALHFSNSFMTADGLVPYFSGEDRAVTVIMLFDYVTVAAPDYIFEANGAGSVQLLLYEYVGTWAFYVHDGASFKQPTGGTALAGRRLITARRNGTTVDVFQAGIKIINAGDVDVASSTFTTFGVGGIVVGTRADIRVAHISIYNTSLSETDRINAEAYITAKRGV